MIRGKDVCEQIAFAVPQIQDMFLNEHPAAIHREFLLIFSKYHNEAEDMMNVDPVIMNLATALGIGLLIGAERERRKGEGTLQTAAGIRTFTLASLAGAISITVGGELVLAITMIGVMALASLAYWRTNEDDPGLTTEVSLILVLLLGGLSMRQPALAAGLAVATTVLLASRGILHNFVQKVLTKAEIKDALVFASATLVVLPLLPNRSMGPYDAFNLYKIWVVVILVMAISAVGYIALRSFGARFGLPIAGLASGFISSTATIGAMGARAAQSPNIRTATVAGATLSTVATVVQMIAVVGTTSFETLQTLLMPLVYAGIAAIAYGGMFTFLAVREKTENELQPGRAFDFTKALIFAAVLSIIMLASAALREHFGETGIIIAAALAGIVDTHAAAISVASLVAAGKMSAANALIPILVGISTNTFSKMIFAITSGGTSFAIRVIPGLILVALAAWAKVF